ncbi:polyphosphate polymerase domain-containing protein [Portibacter marinus]|uniref:polyphosphate polymerase domain-containing protein n=1 Tax=Portibacter marinus TaxID=2898660 RepID=UPI001F461455|nr:polyphosphate polymerase domain-containing protein [Portibacter marinus]
MLTEILRDFESISLAEIAKVALLKRVDTKFVLNQNILNDIVKDWKQHFSVLEINNKVIFQYKTHYFDTPDHQFYFDHQRGKIRRSKVRIREYLDSNQAYFEIKSKNMKRQTDKKRMLLPRNVTDASRLTKEFLEKNSFEVPDLQASINNQFKRFTLVNRTEEERLTIDFDIQFYNDKNKISLENIAIIELKQKEFDRTSLVFETLKKHNVRPTGFSKYCYGLAALNPDLKQNYLLPKFRLLKKLTA